MNEKDIFPASTTALAINHSFNPTAVDMARIFRSLERDYGYRVNASHTGVDVRRSGEPPVYTDGVFQPQQARGKAQCAMYRLRMLKFYVWATEHAPTAEVKQYERWLKHALEG